MLANGIALADRRGGCGHSEQRVNPAQSDGEDIATQHLGSLLVTLIQQTLLRCVRLKFRHNSTPYCQQQRNQACGNEGDVSYRRTG